MSEPGAILAAMVTGLLVGLVFFAGLWWTVRRGLASRQAPLWFAGSFFLRTGIALCGFYAVSHADWRRMLACSAGFLISRMAVIRFTGPGATVQGLL